MPLVDSTFSPPRFLRSGHAATVLPSLLPGRRMAWTRRERLELEDGDFLDLAWQQHRRSRLAILSHGLEGSLQASYIRGMAASLGGAGWDVLAWNYRNCGGVPNRLLRSYHSGESGDLRALVNHAAGDYRQLVLVGFSLGGNITLKYAGEAPPHPMICAAVAVSAPVDLASSARALDERTGNRFYQRRFLKTLLGKTMAKLRQFPQAADPAIVRKIRTIHDFDQQITAPWHGFASAGDYYTRASALPHLGNLRVPTLLLNALNDPLLDAPSFPSAIAESHPCLTLETPAWGGHVGFPDFTHGLQPWHERRVVEFLERCTLPGNPAAMA